MKMAERPALVSTSATVKGTSYATSHLSGFSLADAALSTVAKAERVLERVSSSFFRYYLNIFPDHFQRLLTLSFRRGKPAIRI